MRTKLYRPLTIIILIHLANIAVSQILVDSISFSNTTYGVDLSKDGSLFFVAGKDTTLTIWNERGALEMTLTDHKSSISSVNFFDQEGTILTGSYDNSAILWDLKGNKLCVLEHQKAVISVAQNEQFLATASRDHTAKIWDRNGRLIHTLVGHGGQVNTVQFLEEQRLIVTASFDNSVKFWNYEGKLIKTIEGHSSGIRSFAISNNLIITGHRDGTLSFLDFEGNLKKTIPAHGLAGEEYKMINSVLFLDQSTVLSAGADGYIRIWNIDGQMISETVVAPEEDAYVSGVAIAGSNMVTSSGGKNPMIKIWRLSGTD